MKPILTTEDMERASKGKGNSWPMSFKLMLGWFGILTTVIIYQAKQINGLQHDKQDIIEQHASAWATEKEAERIRTYNEKLRVDSIIYKCESEKQQIYKERIDAVEKDNKKLDKALQ